MLTQEEAGEVEQIKFLRAGSRLAVRMQISVLLYAD